MGSPHHGDCGTEEGWGVGLEGEVGGGVGDREAGGGWVGDCEEGRGEVEGYGGGDEG